MLGKRLYFSTQMQRPLEAAEMCANQGAARLITMETEVEYRFLDLWRGNEYIGSLTCGIRIGFWSIQKPMFFYQTQMHLFSFQSLAIWTQMPTYSLAYPKRAMSAVQTLQAVRQMEAFTGPIEDSSKGATTGPGASIFQWPLWPSGFTRPWNKTAAFGEPDSMNKASQSVNVTQASFNFEIPKYTRCVKTKSYFWEKHVPLITTA